METITEEAERIIGEREKRYGKFKTVAHSIADSWGSLLNVHIEPQTVALMMVMLKVCREHDGLEHSRDNLVDAIGYLLLYENLMKEKQEAWSHMEALN